VIAFLFVTGFLIEERISERTIARRKALLVRLVMNRMWALWVSYNGILAWEKLGREQLAKTEEQIAESERLRKDLEVTYPDKSPSEDPLE
jgi:hypothetical protein